MADNSMPAQLSPTASTYWVLARQILIAAGGTTLGAKYLPASAIAYITAPDTWTALGMAAGGVIAILIGLYRSTRVGTVKAAAALPGATVLLDNQAEADQHKDNPGVVGPADPIPPAKSA